MSDEQAKTKNQSLYDPKADADFLALTDGDGMRLKDLNFTDLYISEFGEAQIKGVDDASGKLESVPEGMISDLHNILEVIVKLYPLQEEDDSFPLDWDGVKYRVTPIEDIECLWFTLRKPMQDVPAINQLGGFILPMIRHLAWVGRKNGLILIAGKTGHGKTTTAYALLRQYLKHYGGVGVTLEDPPEMRFKPGEFPSGRCFQLRRRPNQKVVTLMQKMLRMTPRYIFIGELRRGEDASDALRLANSGHVVITTIHAGSVVEAIGSFVKLSSSEGLSENFSRDLFAQAAAAVIHQEIQVKKSAIPGEGFKKRLKLETFFFGHEEGARQLVREGKINQLNTAIQRQGNLMRDGKDPTPLEPVAKGNGQPGK